MRTMLFALLLALPGYGIAFGSGLSGTFVREYQNVGRLEMNTVFIPTEIRGTNGTSLRIEAFDIPDTVELFIEENNGRISVRVEQRRLSVLPAMNRARLVVSAPSNADFILESASGSFTLSNLHGKELKALSSSGSIECTDMSVPLNLETSSGSIKINRSDTGKLVKAISGSISINQSRGDAVLTAVSGNIRLNNVQGAIKATASSGSINIENFEGRLYLTTVSGRISGSAVKILGEATIETSSGSISLDLTNQARELRFSATSVSGSMEVFDAKGRSRLEGGQGSTRLTLKTVSGSIKIF